MPASSQMRIVRFSGRSRGPSHALIRLGSHDVNPVPKTRYHFREIVMDINTHIRRVSHFGKLEYTYFTTFPVSENVLLIQNNSNFWWCILCAKVYRRPGRKCQETKARECVCRTAGREGHAVWWTMFQTRAAFRSRRTWQFRSEFLRKRMNSMPHRMTGCAIMKRGVLLSSAVWTQHEGKRGRTS